MKRTHRKYQPPSRRERWLLLLAAVGVSGLFWSWKFDELARLVRHLF
jgi:hypothetical protein